MLALNILEGTSNKRGQEAAVEGDGEGGEGGEATASTVQT